MSWNENQPCCFEIYADGHGRPSRIYIKFAGNRPSLLPAKQIGALYLNLRPGLDWGQAEEAMKVLKKAITGLGVRHLAPGE
jgi:hypothetical protein